MTPNDRIIYIFIEKMYQKGLTAVVVTALIASAALFYANNIEEIPENDSALDMTCGFSDDFSNFLKNNGMKLLI
jgi:hypothetical protein